MSSQIFDSIFTKDNAATLDHTKEVLQQKALGVIQQRKQDLANELFFSQQQEGDSEE